MLFERRFEEGYDLTTDTRYNKWLEVTHPSTTFLAHLPAVSQGTLAQLSSGLATFNRPSESVGQLSRFLKQPTPSLTSRQSTNKSKPSSRVLTSAQNLKIIEEKEQQKKTKELEKEERKKVAEEKKKKCEDAKKSKKQLPSKELPPDAKKRSLKGKNKPSPHHVDVNTEKQTCTADAQGRSGKHYATESTG